MNGYSIFALVVVFSLVFSAPGVFSETGADGTGAIANSRSDDTGVLKPIWLKEYVGRGSDWPADIVRTTDGGYLIAANTFSFSFAKPEIWLIKVDSSGNEEWNRILRAARGARVYDIIATVDGGYLLAGYIELYRPPDVVEYNSYPTNMWLVKIDKDGNEIWNRTTGGSKGDSINSISEAPDGGYIIVGSTESYADERMTTLKMPNNDVWMIKINEDGFEEWNRTFGTEYYDYSAEVRSTDDGGYIILAGSILEEGQNTSYVTWLIATDSMGAMTWNKTYGNMSISALGNAFQPTPDGGYIIGGINKNRKHIESALWLCKLNGTGCIEWNELNGGNNRNLASFIHVKQDNNYIVTGSSLSPEIDPRDDVFVMEFDENGTELWSRSLDFGGEENGYRILPADDSCYVILGRTSDGMGKGILLFKLDMVGAGGLDYSGNKEPSCQITTPRLQEDVNGFFRIEGTARDKDGTVRTVEVRIDNGTWQKARGTEKWHYIWNTSKADDGDHTVYARAFDGLRYGYSYVIARVNNAPVDKNATLMPYWGFNLMHRLDADWDSQLGLTPDGGYFLCGDKYNSETRDRNASFTKIDAEGNPIWSRTFGGSEEDRGEMAVPSVDGGYYMVASTRSIGQEGYEDRREPVARVWLIKMSENGNEEWNTLLPWNDSIAHPRIDAAPDGGCFVVGYYFHSADSMERIAFTKIDAAGNVELNHLLDDAHQSRALHIQRTSDLGCIITGFDLCCNTNFRNIFLLKLDPSGSIEWRHKYKTGIGNFVQQTADGGYIIAGERTESYSGLSDMIMIKTDSNGVEEWNTAIGTIFDDSAESVYQTSDGGYIVSGMFGYYGYQTYSRVNDIVVVKLDVVGNEEWRRVFNYNSEERTYFAKEVRAGDYVIAGYSSIFDQSGYSDVVVFKISEDKTGIDWDTYYDDQKPDNDIYPDDDEASSPFQKYAFALGVTVFVLLVVIAEEIINRRRRKNR